MRHRPDATAGAGPACAPEMHTLPPTFTHPVALRVVVEPLRIDPEDPALLSIVASLLSIRESLKAIEQRLGGGLGER